MDVVKNPLSSSDGGGVSRSEIRDWCGLSVTKTAKLAGVTERVIYSWENADDLRDALSGSGLAGNYGRSEAARLGAAKRIASVYVGMIVMLNHGLIPEVRDPAILAAMIEMGLKK